PRAAFRAFLGHPEWLFFIAVFPPLQDMRNPFACALNQHRISRMQAEPLDLIQVVQRRTADGDAANLHWLKKRNRRENSGAADAHSDFADNRRLLMGRIFVGNGPAWGS